MTEHSHYTVPSEWRTWLQEQGWAALPDVLTLVINAARRAEREAYLGAGRYERSPERRGHANGFKPKTVQTRLGDLTFAVPPVRAGGFYPQALEKGRRRERAGRLALAEMYGPGVSTRPVAAISEQLCGSQVSSTQVSRAAADLDTALAAWRSRPRGEGRYRVLDARYERVRVDGQVRDGAVLRASGMDRAGNRAVRGGSVARSAAEVPWREFLRSLVRRGLSGLRLSTSAAHEGRAAARRAVFGAVPWPRCQFHLQQNAPA